MPISKQFKKYFCTGFVCAGLLSALAPIAAFAQLPWGYSPLTGSNSWLWLSRSLYSPSNLLFRNGGYGAGGYLVNTLAYQAVHGVGQGINSLGKKKAAKQFYNNPANGINAPVVDQIAPAPWYKPQGNKGQAQATDPVSTQPSPQAQAILNRDPFAEPEAGNFMPIPATINDDAPSTMPISNPLTAAPPPIVNPLSSLPLNTSLPATAPDFRNSLTQQANSRTQNPSSGNPFAQSFVDHINDKFSGDISKAFADKQTRAYAKALGLESKKIEELPQDRLELIQKILKDPQEDPLTKVNTIRMLIKH